MTSLLCHHIVEPCRITPRAMCGKGNYNPPLLPSRKNTDVQEHRFLSALLFPVLRQSQGMSNGLRWTFGRRLGLRRRRRGLSFKFGPCSELRGPIQEIRVEGLGCRRALFLCLQVLRIYLVQEGSGRHGGLGPRSTSQNLDSPKP